jgi:hypothetical protein
MCKNNIIPIGDNFGKFSRYSKYSIPAYGAVFHAIVWAAFTNCAWNTVFVLGKSHNISVDIWKNDKNILLKVLPIVTEGSANWLCRSALKGEARIFLADSNRPPASKIPTADIKSVHSRESNVFLN